ncbi:MAG TPA: leucyl aminopeptidase [Gemmatimonadales bacterium]|nr:leucyl aminopeptidase [Gemmatimonadales bacterium]
MPRRPDKPAAPAADAATTIKPLPLATAVRAEAPEAATTPLLGLIVPKGGLPESIAAVDRAGGGALGRLYDAGDFGGKRDEIALVYPGGTAARVALVGLGAAGDADRNAIRRAAAAFAKRARQLGVPEAAVFLAPEARGRASAEEAGRALAEGLGYGAWFFGEMKRPPEEKKPTLERIDILAPADRAGMERGHAVGAAIAAGQSLTRGLQVLPGNVCTPTFLAERAQELAERHGFEVTVLDKAAIIREGMQALMAVAQGSAEEPRFIALEYKGSDAAPMVFVGKGVTFDTGGISIKPAQSMEDMKFDMSGAAAVLGTFEMLGRLKPKAHVIGLVPTTENMPSGTAVKPGDVIGSHLGKTIEVINTDAEGRLILVDALSWARRYQPAFVVDAATLTGAIVIGLGHTATGLMGTDEALLEEIRTAGERAGERVWPLPLWDDYRDLIKSDIADVKNTGGRPAGSITAGWFLREFVEGFPWAHLDIAGTAYSDREDATRVKGPTGVGVRLFSELILARQG